jgi:hypothetical protein
MKKTVLVLSLLLAAVAFGQELLTNGDFEQELSVGWVVDTGGYGLWTFDRDTLYQPDPDFEARESLYSGSGICRLSQTVDVPGPTLHLSFSAAFAIGGTSSTCWPVAGVWVGYKDSDGNLLGQTRFYYHNEYCTWTSTSTIHLIEVTNPDWNQYELDVADEIGNYLPGVNPGDVAQLEVALVDTTAGG